MNYKELLKIFDVAELHEAVLERTILNEVYLANTMLKYANLKG
jgi:hypothetical protein